MLSRKLTNEFFDLKEQIQEAYIAVGMVSKFAYEFFIRNLPVDIPQSKVSIITGIHLPTHPDILKKILSDQNSKRINAKMYYKSFFHPKLYVFKLANGWKAFVGSGNFTSGGWKDNIELFVTIESEQECKELIDKFKTWQNESIDITQEFIDKYESTFIANQARINQNKKNIEELVAELNGDFNIDRVNFNGQFFKLEHHLALAPEKMYLETPLIISERKKLRKRLYDLDALVHLSFPSAWDIHHHYEEDHIVAHIENHFHHDERVRSLWVAYGRSKPQLKAYSSDATPLNFMRLQVIVHYDDIGIWLMPGKTGGGEIDRTFFKNKMKNDIPYRLVFFSLLSSLVTDYWIEIMGERRLVTSFSSADDLLAFTNKDNWRYDYFIIGRNYKLGSIEMLEINIKATVLHEFGKLMPLYNHMKHYLI